MVSLLSFFLFPSSCSSCAGRRHFVGRFIICAGRRRCIREKELQARAATRLMHTHLCWMFIRLFDMKKSWCLYRSPLQPVQMCMCVIDSQQLELVASTDTDWPPHVSRRNFVDGVTVFPVDNGEETYLSETQMLPSDNSL